MAEGREAEANEAVEEAERLFRAQRNRVQSAHAALLRAHALERVGNRSGAVSLARTAAGTFARAGMHGWAAEARWIPALDALDAGRTALLRAVLRAAQIEERGWLCCRAEQALGRHAHLVQPAQRRL